MLKEGNNLKPRYIGKFYNRIKRGNGFTVLEAVFLSTLIDLYNKAQKNGITTLDNYFPTDLGEIMKLSRIPVYEQMKLIDGLVVDNVINYVMFRWDINATMLFKLNYFLEDLV